MEFPPSVSFVRHEQPCSCSCTHKTGVTIVTIVTFLILIEFIKHTGIVSVIFSKIIIWKAQGCHNKITQPIPSTKRKRKPLRTETT